MGEGGGDRIRVWLRAEHADHGSELLGDVSGTLLHRVGRAQRPMPLADLLLRLACERLIDEM